MTTIQMCSKEYHDYDTDVLKVISTPKGEK